MKIAKEKVRDFEKQLFEYVDRRHPELPEMIRTEKKITEEVEAKLKEVLESFVGQYVEEQGA